MIKNEKLDLKEFYEIRKEVLSTWPTGQKVNLEEAFKFHRTIQEERRFAWTMKGQRKKARLFFNPGPEWL